MVQNKADRKKAVAVILIIAVVLIWMVLNVSAADDPFGGVSVNSVESCAEYLSELGWETDIQNASVQTTVLPETFDDVYTQYNELQKMQGSDLTKYAGKEVTVYTLPVTNYSGSDGTVYATVLTYNNDVIGGDIHSAEMGGFMHALK